MIEITTKLTQEDFIKLNFHLLYRKWAVKTISILGVFFIIVSVLTIFSGNSSWFLLVFGLFITVGLRLQVYFAAKRNFKSNGRISESITYKFDKENIQIKGESFDLQMSWDKVYSVTENKDFVLIWQSRQIANAINKRDYKNSEKTTFKEIVNLQKGIKNKIK